MKTPTKNEHRDRRWQRNGTGIASTWHPDGLSIVYRPYRNSWLQGHSQAMLRPYPGNTQAIPGLSDTHPDWPRT